MKKLIVNGDDLGLNARVNRAVERGLDDGLITDTSIMANGPAFEEAAAFLRRRTQGRTGVHLNVVEGSPVSEHKFVPSLLNGGARFHGSWSRAACAMVSGGMRTGEVYSEWRAQIEKVLAFGLKPTHLDSHHHLHWYPPFFRIVARLAVEFGVMYLRTPRLDRGFSLRAPLPYYLRWLIFHGLSTYPYGRVLRALGLSSPDRLLGVPEEPGFLPAGLGRGVDGINELLCHPGQGTESGPDNTLRRLQEIVGSDSFDRSEWSLTSFDEVKLVQSVPKG